MCSMETYTLLRVIGEGSFGRALLVHCKSNQEKYVVKEIQLPKNQSKLEISRREAILLSRMKHPNIVAFREAFEADDLLCIVMEYCSGGDLLQRIQQQKNTQFCIDDILRWFAQMCAGAKHIHDKRVLHRDLKSKNIFLAENGTVKLGDFGSACILNSSKAYAHTYVGTPYYVAPEIWDNKPYNNKSDVWSLGCVLYELCTLRHPFQASSWKSLILKVCRGAYPPLPSHLPYELQYLVKQMFRTNPKDRPSLHTILTSHRVSKLLRSHLPSEVIETEEQGRRMGRWNIEEGKKVANLLGEKSLIKLSTFEGMESAEGHCENREPGHRKQWAAAPSDTVLQMLANASLVSSDSMASTSQTLIGSAHANVPEEPEESRQRRQWVRDPPERLLSLLEKARLSRAFSTFLINRGGDDLLVGPLSQPQGDDTDGPELEVAVDEDRLEPRSDDEDTDFEEESPCDWIDEVEKMFSEH
ncbi:serine/threonine-protein kinase Nek3 isoform X3 [Lates calcarifer]|uniref:non-specific serine/threonine protein kinase n=1 Tax=Lates calcarifer TaxID=8187 RepID=A0A4W6C7W8_LATCA|nr:serine/threonine-protein kinase Nek3 isoform X3 [Lates calcarifer]